MENPYDDPRNYPEPMGSIELGQTRPTGPLEVFDVERYFASKANACLFCGEESLEGGPINIDGTTAVQDVFCTNCQARWQDVYELHGVDNIYGPKGSPIGGYVCRDDN